MKIQYLGHACFKISSTDGELVIDPYKDGSVDGLQPLRVDADKVICTHGHADHSGTECVTLSDTPCSMKIEEIASWHDDQQGALRGPNTMFVIESEGLRVAHIGDLGCMLDDEQKNKLQNLDVLMLPVGGYFTIDGKQAAAIAKELQPKCIIPMHYRGDGFGYPVLSTVDDFLAEFENYERVGNIISFGEGDEPRGVLMPAFQ